MLSILLLSHGAVGEAATPLHEQIDALLAQAADGPPAEPADDAAFLRRVMLDFAGRIPTADEARAFLNDDRADKRSQLIDEQLASPAFARHLRNQLHVMLMERLGDHDEWLDFLERSIAQRRPWDAVVRNILDPDADDETVRGSAFFWTKRLENYGQNPVDYPALTRDVGRLFLGVDLQCAQCHDHLFVDAYRQIDFQGLSAFVGHTFIRQDVQFPAVGEKPLSAAIDFTSVLTSESAATGPRLPGRDEVPIPTFGAGEEFEIPPDKAKKFPGRPKFRPLAVLAREVTTPDHTAFSRNSVNRFWALLFGRGLVHPLDLHHPGNPPSHPELLDLLAAEFRTQGYDLHGLLRELALTQAYQRSSRYPSGAGPPPEASYRAALERPLTAEQLLAGVVIAVGHPQLAGVALGDSPEPAAVKEYARQLARFRAAFANPPRDPEGEFRPSVQAALFLMNDGAVLEWVRGSDAGSTAARLAALPDEAVAENLYLSILTRRPDPAEREFVAGVLQRAGQDRQRTMSHLVWGLLASAEFALNH